MVAVVRDGGKNVVVQNCTTLTAETHVDVNFFAYVPG